MINDKAEVVEQLRLLSRKLADNLYSEALVNRSFQEADEELRSLGVDTNGIAEEQAAITGSVPVTDGDLSTTRSTAHDDGSHSPDNGLIFGLKRLLGELELQTFAAMHLGDKMSMAEADSLRVVRLERWPQLQEHLPWLGSVLRIYQQERHSAHETATYVAVVETKEVESPRQQGELKVILAADDEKRSEVSLSFDFPSCEFPLRLPAAEDTLTLECYASRDL